MNDESVLVHITGSDVPGPSLLVPRSTRTAYSTQSVANVIADGTPRQLLSYAPTRLRAALIVTGNAGDTAIIAGSSGDAARGIGATVIPMGAPIVLRGTDEAWLGQGAGNSIVVSVIAEYES